MCWGTMAAYAVGVEGMGSPQLCCEADALCNLCSACALGRTGTAGRGSTYMTGVGVVMYAACTFADNLVMQHVYLGTRAAYTMECFVYASECMRMEF